MKTEEEITREQHFLLTNEAGIAAIAIGEGLTALRKTSIMQRANSLYAFFSLSIGIERLMKLILIISYRNFNKNQFPQNGDLKKYGHNIHELFCQCKIIANEHNEHELYKDLASEAICNEILMFLNDFAIRSRYYNLDVLTGMSPKNEEPFKRWHDNINSPIILKHYKKRKNGDIIDAFLTNYEDLCYISISDFTGKAITSLGQLAYNDHVIDTCSKYSVFYTYKIIRFLSILLYRIESSPPFLSEFFEKFRCNDKEVMKTKVWSPYKR